MLSDKNRDREYELLNEYEEAHEKYGCPYLLEKDWDLYTAKCESAIEPLFLVGLINQYKRLYKSRKLEAGGIVLYDSYEDYMQIDLDLRHSSMPLGYVVLCPQAEIELTAKRRYRYDFLINYFEAKELKSGAYYYEGNPTVVECDGFSPHGNKRAMMQDRERDIYTQLAGFKVARFMGASLYKNPLQCANLALKLVLQGIASNKKKIQPYDEK